MRTNRDRVQRQFLCSRLKGKVRPPIIINYIASTPDPTSYFRHWLRIDSIHHTVQRAQSSSTVYLGVEIASYPLPEQEVQTQLLT